MKLLITTEDQMSLSLYIKMVMDFSFNECVIVPAEALPVNLPQLGVVETNLCFQPLPAKSGQNMVSLSLCFQRIISGSGCAVKLLYHTPFSRTA